MLRLWYNLMRQLVVDYNKLMKKLTGAKLDYIPISAIIPYSKCSKYCPKIKPSKSKDLEAGVGGTIDLIPNVAPRKDIISPIECAEPTNDNDYELADKAMADGIRDGLLAYLLSKRGVDMQVVYIINPNDYEIELPPGVYLQTIIEAGADGLLLEISEYPDIGRWNVAVDNDCVIDTAVGYHNMAWSGYVASYCAWSFSVPQGQSYTDNPNWDNPSNQGTNYITCYSCDTTNCRNNTGTGYDMIWGAGNRPCRYTFDTVVIERDPSFTVNTVINNSNDLTSTIEHTQLVTMETRHTLPNVRIYGDEYTQIPDSDWYVAFSGTLPVKTPDCNGAVVGYEDFYEAYKIRGGARAYSGFNGRCGQCVFIRETDTEQEKLDKVALTRATGYGSGGGHILYEPNVTLPNDIPNKGTQGVIILSSWCCNGIQL